ncbi:MAG: DUF1653 domain-containing protein [Lachnospiraceae bacterium]|nr:DUF1653 domain-containing protein [Lachnospiraceae bacterium]
MREIPKAGEVYRHFKGNNYEVISIATGSEDGESQVVYKALYAPYTVYVRPLEMFMEKVNKEKYPNAIQVYRFEKIDPEKEAQEEEKKIDQRLIAFLETKDYQGKLDILDSMEYNVSEQTVIAMAVSMDIELNDGTVEEKFRSLRKCIQTMQMYEGKRLR